MVVRAAGIAAIVRLAMTQRFAPHTVTFDCWQTLIYEDRPLAHAPAPAHGRVKILAEVTGLELDRVASALRDAWLEHQRAWHRRIAFAGPEMTQHVLQALDVQLSPARTAELVAALEDETLGHPIAAVEGAVELLGELRSASVRVALICDTGFSPGRVVRQLLARVGLLEHLEVQIFSDEIRVPKPHPKAFSAALDGLGVAAAGAVHVGDLRRSDIAGARAAGMRSVRFAGMNDDASDDDVGSAGVVDCATAGCDPTCARPEADAVIGSYRELAGYLR